jgi:hypothetical protein
MRTIITLSAIIAVIVSSGSGLYATPVGVAQQLNATPLWHRAGGYYEGYRPACPYGYFYACFDNPYYGHVHCGCWPYYGRW